MVTRRLYNKALLRRYEGAIKAQLPGGAIEALLRLNCLEDGDGGDEALSHLLVA